jgi:tetratricopeptide (TPR) repeat protein
MAQVFADSPDFKGKFWADVRSQTSMTVLAARALQEFGVLPKQVENIEEKDLIPCLLRLLQQGRYLLAIDNLESVLTPEGAWLSGYEEFWQGFQDIGSESVLLLASREYPPRYLGFLRSRWQLLDQGLTNIEGAALLAALEVEDSQQNRERASEQVQGNPLALSLIAGWLRVSFRPGERFLQSLEGWQQLVGSHRGEKLTVEQVLQWSLDRLTETQRLLLAQLSVLRGAFGLELAQALFPDALVTMEILEDLERRSILQYLSPGEYRFQPRLREFVKERTADLTTARERAIVYFWEHRQQEFTKDDPLSAIAEYEETFYHLCQLRHYQDAFSTVFVCDDFLRLRGHYTTLVNLYGQLHRDWQPTTEEQQDYGAVCNNLGVLYFSLGQHKEALKYHQQSLEIKREIGDRDGEAVFLNNLGNVYQSLGQYHEALKYHQQSLEIFREIGVAEGTQSDRSGEANSLGNLGVLYSSLGQYKEALKYHQQSLEIQREINNGNGEANSLNGLGNVYQSLGQYHEALKYHQQSLAIQREIGDRNGEATSLNNLGNVYQSLGQYQEALNLYQQSLAIQREIGDRNGEATSLNNLGNVCYLLGQYQEALNFFQQSLTIKREIGDRNVEANSLNGLGNVYQSLGQYQEALNFFQQSLEIFCEIGARNGEATSLNNLGNVCYLLGQYQEALNFFQQSLTIQCEIGDRNGEASSLIGLGNVYYSLGQYQEALNFYQQSLMIQREISDLSGEANSLMNLGNVYNSLGQYQEALKYHQQSLAIQREIGDHNGEANSLGNLGNVYYSLGQYQEALDFFQQSLEIKREIGDHNGEATSLNGLGNVYQSLGQYQETLKYYQQSLVIKREIGDRNGEALSLWNISVLYQQSGKIRQARQYKVLAVRIWQSLKLPLDATPMPEISKRTFRQLEAQGKDWADAFIQSMEQLGWLMDIIGGIAFLIFLPIRLFQKFKTNFFVWFVAGLALTFLIWYLKK